MLDQDGRVAARIGGVDYWIDVLNRHVVVEGSSSGAASSYQQAVREMFDSAVQQVAQEIRHGLFAPAIGLVRRSDSVPDVTGASVDTAGRQERSGSWPGAVGANNIKGPFAALKSAFTQEKQMQLQKALRSVQSCDELAVISRRVSSSNRFKAEPIFNRRLGEILRQNLNVRDTAGLYEVCNGLAPEDFDTLTPLLIEQLCSYEASGHVKSMTQPSLIKSSHGAGKEAKADSLGRSLLTDALAQHLAFQNHGGGMYVTDR